MKSNRFSWVSLALPGACLLHATASGQSADLSTLDELLVTGSPTDRTLFEQAQPANLLSGSKLMLNLESTLGETLRDEPGISSTAFGPGASRPVIRGLGEDRVRILQNGTSVLDVSNVSPDHAVASNPLTARSVEVVRGPATLLYGPNTLGGVVNVIDGRIPDQPFTGSRPTGSFSSRFGSVDNLEQYAGELDYGQGDFAFHLDAFSTQTDNLKIPGFARSARARALDPLPPGETEAYGILPNSATESRGAALGGTWFHEGGYIGLSFSGEDSLYGTVAEPDVTIDLRQRRWDLRGAFDQPATWIREIDYRLSYSDYQHTEFEGIEPGTEFLIEGFQGRVELLHEKLGPFEGAIGMEAGTNDFSALGDEAFLPPVQNQAVGLFLFEEVPLGDLRFQFGARYDHHDHETDASAAFGPSMKRDFDAFSTSTGLVWEPADGYAVALSAAYTRRPPTYVELFANGPHVATGTFEIGDPFLGTEDALSFDLSLRKNTGRVTGSASVFHYRFDDYINLAPTGTDFVDPEDGGLIPIYHYTPVAASFTGGEIEATFHLLETPSEAKDAKSPVSVSQRLDLSLQADYVHAENRSTGDPLPRIPPFRSGVALEYGRDALTFRIDGQYAAHQDRHAPGELPTDSYFLVNAALSYQLDLGDVTTTFFLKGTNLTDEEARLSTSFLKEVAPLGGRGVVAGIRAEF
ncbi:TonB-dependent receptor [Luteolibacter marinus]|uniref:TonB-dependent receptor n=1 Tax=Luteolibacter marinus TaxID=2776705 RepID=UPI001867C1A4|nr:TonB-dependent receptor [Luteolibacter marinus]